MTNELIIPHDGPPQAGDGFSGSSRSHRVGRGSYLKWNDKQGWIDRDGVAAPSPMLVFDVDEILRRWKNNVAEDIVDKPLPDPDDLNGAIPVEDWEKGVDGKRRPPWAHTVVVYLVNLSTGENYTYAAATTGAHIAFDALTEAVKTMRVLRGTLCVPIVNLTDRPMKMKFGHGKRPHLEIIGWRTLGRDPAAVPTRPPAPQLPSPSIGDALPSSTPASAGNRVLPTQPEQQNNARQAKPKPSIDIAGETLATLGDVKPVTTAEILDDEITF
ncbi:hypothetical protein [Bradyrhizobium sp. MOS002]|uniref:hypothetical protein n=1 Tax=Bradyrhizobium sp. MOS002 TaxID=2133947 RepID=UPI000D11B744|nr:hypothetical protein [Bradyrhizobium sp. MOS002]PSO25113.1 hypothetical protein C7G41_29795 [Bradyrhizobium sp. MOS002]